MDTAPQAPPVEANNAVKAKTREHAISTQQTTPVKRRKGPIIGASIVAVGIIAGASIVIFANGKKDHSHDAAQVAQVTPGSDQKPTEQPTPVPSVPSTDTAGSAGSAEVATPPTPPDNAAEGSDAGSGSAAAPVKDTAAKQSAKQSKRTTTTQVKTTAGSGSATTTAKTTAPEVAVVQPPAGKPVDAGMLAAQYKSVGSALKALEDSKGRDAASDLWARYRYIRFSDAMTTQQKRDEASAILSKLTNDISSRKK
jgi:hypothetical protein